MKKIIAVTIVALMMFAVATSAFALVVDTAASYKNPPVFISGLTVSDAWMSGLTAQNWQGSLTNQAYAEGSYIWFIARVSVAAEGDTDAAHLWDSRDGNDQTATLTLTGKDNCLNFASANMASLAQISGMSVTARQIQNSNMGIVEATENKAVFTFTNQKPFAMDSNRVLQYTERLANLVLDAIYPADAWSAADPLQFLNGNSIAWGGVAAGVRVGNRATLQKDYYLHFMGITKASTEGVCIGTLKVNGTDTFKRDPLATTGPAASYTTSGSWYNSGTTVLSASDTLILPGDRSNMYLLYNTVNGKHYSVMKINGEAAPATAGVGLIGPFRNAGHIYVVMNKDASEFVIGFAVSNGVFQGLVTWENDYRIGTINGRAGSFNAFTNRNTWDAAYYIPLMSNDYSNNLVNLVSAYRNVGVSTAELQAIFDFFGFAYVNPRCPTDADFLGRSGLVTVAEAKYNVANAVITTPDDTIVIPKTGDAATSTGLILVASAILAAAAVGFVLSKRAHN